MQGQGGEGCGEGRDWGDQQRSDPAGHSKQVGEFDLYPQSNGEASADFRKRVYLIIFAYSVSLIFVN